MLFSRVIFFIFAANIFRWLMGLVVNNIGNRRRVAINKEEVQTIFFVIVFVSLLLNERQYITEKKCLSGRMKKSISQKKKKQKVGCERRCSINKEEVQTIFLVLYQIVVFNITDVRGTKFQWTCRMFWPITKSSCISDSLSPHSHMNGIYRWCK